MRIADSICNFFTGQISKRCGILDLELLAMPMVAVLGLAQQKVPFDPPYKIPAALFGYAFAESGKGRRARSCGLSQPNRRRLFKTARARLLASECRLILVAVAMRHRTEQAVAIHVETG